MEERRGKYIAHQGGNRQAHRVTERQTLRTGVSLVTHQDKLIVKHAFFDNPRCSRVTNESDSSHQCFPKKKSLKTVLSFQIKPHILIPKLRECLGFKIPVEVFQPLRGGDPNVTTDFVLIELVLNRIAMI